MKKTFFCLLLFFLFVAPAKASAEINYFYKDYKNLIGRQTFASPLKIKTPQIGIVPHHLPTASPMLDNFYLRLKQTRPDIKTFVVIGPDHFEKCRQKFVTTDESVNTMFGRLTVDQKIFVVLRSAGIKKEAGCFRGEHAIGVQANYIKKFFPRAQIVPVLLSYSAQKQNFEKPIQALMKNKVDIFVIQSTDFSHYINADKANVNDRLSSKWLKELNSGSFTLKQVDSPGTMKLILQLAKTLKLKPEIIDHKNSFDLGGSFTNTTSYFTVMF